MNCLSVCLSVTLPIYRLVFPICHGLRHEKVGGKANTRMLGSERLRLAVRPILGPHVDVQGQVIIESAQ